MIIVMHIYLPKELSVKHAKRSRASANNNNNKLIFKNFGPFIYCNNKYIMPKTLTQ